MLEHPWSSPPIACSTRSRIEEHTCWLGRGTLPQSGRIHPVMRVKNTWSLCYRCRQLGCSACPARWSLQVRVRSSARHRHIPYERPARAPRNQCQPIWAFSVGTAKARWFLKNRDAGWGKRSCCDIIEMVAPYCSAWSSLTYKTVSSKIVDLCSTAALMGNTKF